MRVSALVGVLSSLPVREVADFFNDESTTEWMVIGGSGEGIGLVEVDGDDYLTGEIGHIDLITEEFVRDTRDPTA